METLQAFRAVDGKIFFNEKECIDYEEILKDYPKISHETREDSKGVVYHCVKTQNKPNGKKAKDEYYVINDMWKVTFDSAYGISWIMKHLNDMYDHDGNMLFVEQYYSEVCRMLLAYNNEKFIIGKVARYLEDFKYANKFTYAEKDGKMIFDDESWKTGMHAKATMIVEKIK